MLVSINFLFVFSILVYADSPPGVVSTAPTILMKNAPTYRDGVIQATDPIKLADPTLATYVRDSAPYRTSNPPIQNLPAPSPPNFPPPLQHKVLESDFRMPNNTEGVVQNITVVVPPNSNLPAKHFYDQLAQGKTPRKLSFNLNKYHSNIYSCKKTGNLLCSR